MHYHDALWKGLLQAFFPDFLQLTVPEIAAELRLEEGRFLEKESLFEPPDGQLALADLVAEVPAGDGAEKLILVHVEVERSFGRGMDLRMWRYFAHLCLKYSRPIIPIVLFLRGGKAGVTRRQVDIEFSGFVINRFTYWALGLSASKARDLLEQPPLGVALAACARGDRLARHEQKYLCMEAILDSTVSKTEQRLLVTAVETYLELNEEQKMKYAERVARSSRSAEVTRMELTWAGKLHQKGMELGRREGVELGKREGVELGRREGVELGRREGVELGRREGVELGRRMLLKLAEQRFGQLPSSFIGRIARLEDPARLDRLSDQVLSVGSLADLEDLVD